MTIERLNFTLAVLNEAWAILLACFAVVLIVYLIDQTMERRVGISSWLFRMPLPMQVAVSILIADIGNLIIASAVWWWQTTTHGSAPFAGSMILLIVAGSAVRAVGMLCKTRVFSRELLGHWPWIITGAIVLVWVVLRTTWSLV